MHDTRRPSGDVASHRKGRCGRKFKHESIAERLRNVPKARRTAFRSIAAALHISRSTLHDYCKRGIFVKYKSNIRPALTEANKAVRLKWSLQHVHASNADLFNFEDIMNVVPVDESQEQVLPGAGRGATTPHLQVEASHYKGDFFVGRRTAASGCRNRPAGTLESKPVSVTRVVDKKMLIEQVITAIKAMCPGVVTDLVTIQQDVPPSDADIVSACTSGGWNIRVVYQSPNSPDLNVLDLGFFRGIQSIQEKNHSRRVDDIVAATEAAWLEVDKETLNFNL
ncbi:hypothetical protein H257_02235 [Aphanomyces astaci]|uniref:Transposase Tc1-like domain-containing protein n=1 Tax=Aphanomyces astaci TaxID=112090 RepID=W4H7L2_APHAT|nr:hypothetical protein H257_02235 [Aphanomyces astaci]ETV87289.1 hypothetical protein H257_02235 [Aphanomyces astaci]|eukprot:XP_009824088.1 hypothetical protein H257_02235 [Aphanomyces astaci]